MLNVALVGIGDCTFIDTTQLASILNRISHVIKFHKDISIPIRQLKEPEKSGIWHFTDTFYELLDSQQYRTYDCVIGITNVRITTRDPYPGDVETDYFSHQDYKRLGVISCNNEVLRHNSPTKDVYQYVAFAVLEILLGNILKVDLHHDRLEYCLFHDCADRSSFASMIEKSVICTNCLDTLKKQVCPEIIKDVDRILGWCRRYSGEHSPLKATIRNPLSAFVFGTGAGWLTSTLLPADSKVAIGCAVAVTTLTPAFTLAIYCIKNMHRSAQSTV